MPFFAPVSSGGVPLATVTATTGSPTIDTTSRSGKTIYKFTGSGTITIGTAGTCEYMVLGPGGSNGAGGYRYTTSGILPAGTLTVTIGAGSQSYTAPNESRLNDIIGLGGGSGQAPFTSTGTSGASGAGASATAAQGGIVGSADLSGYQGNAGGYGNAPMGGPPAIGGGGGAGGVGGDAPSSNTGGNGGAGAANSITGTSTTYCAGGGGYGTSVSGTPTGAGAANTGNGGNSNIGGSGFVVIVIG